MGQEGHHCKCISASKQHKSEAQRKGTDISTTIQQDTFKAVSLTTQQTGEPGAQGTSSHGQGVWLHAQLLPIDLTSTPQRTLETILCQ